MKLAKLAERLSLALVQIPACASYTDTYLRVLVIIQIGCS